MEIQYTPAFIRQFNTLEADLKEEAYEKIDLFRDKKNHQKLKVHKLTGRLAGRYSFSVNYRYRIVFSYIAKDTLVFLTIGDHDVYKT